MTLNSKEYILTVNGGSSSIKFALFDASDSLKNVLKGSIERIGLPSANFVVKGSHRGPSSLGAQVIPDYKTAVKLIINWLDQAIDVKSLIAVGHRLVHGGSKYWEPQQITADMVKELRQLSLFDPEHLPEEILLIEALSREFPDLPQIACFDTAFHQDMPRVAQILPIPRQYESKGIRRYGFHGLSYTYLMQELEKLSDVTRAQRRIILAHLGNGASLAAVRDGHSLDTTMAFTPSSGLVMGTRCGDIDPGIVSFLIREEGLFVRQFDQMVNHKSGLLGISETSSDMQDLLARESEDVRAAEAIALFCYQVKKWIGAYTAVLGGLDTLVFAGGIGENNPSVRARICEGLGFLGIEIDGAKNMENADVISCNDSRVIIRVMPTDEELMISRFVAKVLGINA